MNYIRDKTGAIAEETRGGKTYIVIRDFQKMRQGVGQLLAELIEGRFAEIADEKALAENVLACLELTAADERRARRAAEKGRIPFP